MTPIVLDLGQSRSEQRALSFSKADKERILQSFPDKIEVAVSGFGNREFPLRAFVKSFIEQVQPPTARMTFSVEGDVGYVAHAAIENSRLKIVGPSSGSFQTGDVEVAYAFDVDVEPGATKTLECTCDDGRAGAQRARSFKFIWQIEISIDPGIAGVFEIEEFEIAVETPCICSEPEPVDEPDHDMDEQGEHEKDADDNDDDDDDHKRKKRKKKR
ncbi:MAG: hypothetical protein NTV56_25815 [Alphaproteobacteria bacterium]|nr:hypothetical protein [Alphaproteobacteria bacterium]